MIRKTQPNTDWVLLLLMRLYQKSTTSPRQLADGAVESLMIHPLSGESFLKVPDLRGFSGTSSFPIPVFVCKPFRFPCASGKGKFDRIPFNISVIEINLIYQMTGYDSTTPGLFAGYWFFTAFHTGKEIFIVRITGIEPDPGILEQQLFGFIDFCLAGSVPCLWFLHTKQWSDL